MNQHQLKDKFEEYYGKGGEIKLFFAPGRVNLIGEHIDYNGGFVFPAALTIGITALWRKRNDNNIVMHSLNLPGEIIVDLAGNLEYDEKDDWGNYPKGVFNFLLKENHALVPADILFYSDLPDGAGLSSSAAIEVLTAFMSLRTAGVEKIDLIWLSKFSQKVENQYIGVNCGIMDQFSVANGREGHAMLLNCETLDYQLIPFEMKDHVLVIMNTNKRRELADSKYNERRAECDKALELLNTVNHYKNLCEADMEQVGKLIKEQVLIKRVRHVVSENQRVIASVEVLKKGDLAKFGSILDASHASLKEDYEVTGKELDAIVSAAQHFEGCLGARMTGAGFGGCAIAIVKQDRVDLFIKTVGEEYRIKTGLVAEFYVSTIGNGVHALNK